MELTLTTGDKRHYAVGDYGTDESALLKRTAPFSSEWIKTAEGTWARLDQVVEVRRVELDTAPPLLW